MTVKTILARKGSSVVTIDPTATVAIAAKTLTERGIGALVVTGAEGRTIGIVSERDIVRALGQRGVAVLDTSVADIMTRRVVTCGQQDTIGELMQQMTDGKFRHVPVVEQDRLIGIVSIGDVVKSRLEQMEQESNALRDYIRTA
ncbi:CBS domain-containing protein [Rhodoplanes serenus]|uniref:CBS domain-containing protein n=1 Tax=Rhodoplanes serenus TaxID=200615 RepID=A0A327KBE4_9BRAD|nr:CBS domain-containing protein [Rhodoplanes serenus]MBI5113264.1 CBS domain-containing protein [Rhodovulum sp.]MTW16469.1 CBS domain-containing protein [Rhodoplanes serenus]RAI34965.1 inosine-5-monophosphate dehydrogenase [Rhodoplanes serenus]VCU09616.1 Hypoxic response protein 1 [Rhodoplanes serenus]